MQRFFDLGRILASSRMLRKRGSDLNAQRPKKETRKDYGQSPIFPNRFRTVLILAHVLLFAAWVLSAQAEVLNLRPVPVDPALLRDPALAKVSRDLIVLQQEFRANQQLPILQAFRPSNPVVRIVAGRVVIDAVATGDARLLLADLKALGLQRGAIRDRMVSGQLPIAAISELADLQSLKLVRPAYVMSRAGLVDSQGDVAMRSDIARTDFEVDGTGVVVGSLSDSFDCAGTQEAVDVGSGDLPADIVVLDDTACPGIDEGRAMMQLIHDVAPGAAQAFHTAFNGQADFAEGIVELATTAGAHIIVDDVIYFAEPMFQDGIIAQAIDAVSAKGVAYFSSAGNEARDSYESEFRDSGVVGPLGGIRHDFDPGPGVDDLQTVILGTGTTIFSFQWDEPFFSVSGEPGSASDLDILLYLEDGTFTFAGGFALNVGGDPVEVFAITRNGPPIAVQIGLELNEGPPPKLMKYVFFGPAETHVGEFDTASGALYGHPNAAGAEAVGAAFYAKTPDFGVTPARLEPFSSAGPTPILFDSLGNRLAKPEIRNKPEVIGPDGTNTTFFFAGEDPEPDGFPNFFGTSASAPHAAGVAALMLQANSKLKPAEIFAGLEKTADDMETPGFDFDSGHGFIQADAAVEAVLPQAPDLTGEWILIRSRPLLGQYLVRGRLRVSNIGNEKAGRFRIFFHLSDDGITPGKIIARRTIWAGLLPGESKIRAFRLLSPESLAGKFVIAVVDSKNEVAESDETNNNIAITIP
ncbi:MAG: S8 family serine peptidase [Desulfobacterales bacterium]|nr:MAG: S8 family serine peptidase [Desulfobacterales bacterium]